MNRQYSRDGLLKTYQQEASDMKNRKVSERQIRINEERNALDMINRELEQEKRTMQNSKIQRMSEMKEEYNQMLMKKQQNTEEYRNRQKSKYDINGTFKIGSENREIKKKNYEEVSNTLVLNPTRGNLNNAVRGRDQNVSEKERIPQRNKSQGFNIINHTAYEQYPKNLNIQEELPQREYNQRGGVQLPREENYNNINQRVGAQFPREENYNNINQRGGVQLPREENYNNQKTNPNNYENKMNNYQSDVEGVENLENYPYGQNDDQNNEFDDPEFKKYYEEYLRQKLREEEMKQQEQISNEKKVGLTKPGNNNDNKSSFPTNMEEYKNYMNNLRENDSYGAYGYDQQNRANNNQVKMEEMNQLENQMNNLNIKYEQNKEYANNRAKNQNTYGYNSNNVMQSREPNSYGGGNQISKLSQQQDYRNFLNSQVKEKNNINNFNSVNNTTNISNNRTRINKRDIIPSNPYSNKNYEFGGTSLSNNPITNPVNSYQFNYERYKQTNLQNERVGSARMREVGNNIIK